jgi:hypothetical protein
MLGFFIEEGGERIIILLRYIRRKVDVTGRSVPRTAIVELLKSKDGRD